MNELIKYLGIILALIGALILIIPNLLGMATTSNVLFIVSLVLFISGFFAHIYINKRYQ